jgi:hypothetical protein
LRNNFYYEEYQIVACGDPEGPSPE